MSFTQTLNTPAEPQQSRTSAIVCTPSSGPVFLEGRLVLSCSFQGTYSHSQTLADIEQSTPLLETYGLYDELRHVPYKEDVHLLRFDGIDVLVRVLPDQNDQPRVLWTGQLDVRARVILYPDLRTPDFQKNQAVDLCWKRLSDVGASLDAAPDSS